MNTHNGGKEEEKKGGFGSALSALFRGGTSAAGGASGAGSTGGLAGLFAGKAGLAGMLLGGATIAAGVGVVYNFMSPSDKPVYSQELFQNSYYEEESAKAGLERTQARNAGVASSIDVFREQAKKDGLGGLAAEAVDGEAPDAAAEAGAGTPGADSAAEAPGAAGSEAGASGAPRMVASSGFAGKGGGGSGSSMPRMQGGGGMSGGIGGQFTSVYRPPAQANGGKTSGMTAAAARIKNSPKSVVPSFNKKGAFGQAKYAGRMGAKAAYSADGSGARSTAAEAFSGETSGSGDVAGAGGAGLGGAGVSNGANLKGNDPNMNSNQSTPPKVPAPENVSPWKKTLDMIMYAMLISAALTMVANWMAGTVWGVAYAQYVAMAAMLAAAVVLYGAFKMLSTYGQKWTGAMYGILGAVLMIMANRARVGAAEKADVAAKEATVNSQEAGIVESELAPQGEVAAQGEAVAQGEAAAQGEVTVTEIPPEGTTYAGDPAGIPPNQT
ncbi:MAG: hypothetical protein A2081_01535 [Elusimicrobia bacterium GWC2_61_19]|nr:MAG: hypothetical protein A2081_01535 [Elusimicrobia bacterium GWC2_61_19]